MNDSKNVRTGKIAPVCVPAILLIVLITLIRTVDIAPIGPEGTSVGLATINGGFHSFTGLNLIWLNISKYLGYLSFVIPAVMVVCGIAQLIKRKSIKKVDSWLLCLGGLYALTAVVYALFEVIIINYRPEILPDEDHIEASFPSTHSMLAVVILGSLIAVLPILIDKIKTCRALQICLGILMAAIVIGRLLSGAHWLTDVLGGVIMGALLLGVFGVSVDELMQVKADSQDEGKKNFTPLINLILKGIALAMGIAVVVLSTLGEIDTNSGFGMLGIGLACLAVTSLAKKDDNE